jgi:hypothetical protein
MIPDGLEPSSPGCEPGIFAAGLRDRIHTDAEAVGLEPTNEMFPPPVFKTGSSSSRMTSVNFPLRELESNQRFRVQGPASLPAATIPQFLCVEGHERRFASSRIAGAGIEPAPPGSKPSIAANSDYPASRRGTGGTRTHALVPNKHLLCR